MAKEEWTSILSFQNFFTRINWDFSLNFWYFCSMKMVDVAVFLRLTSLTTMYLPVSGLRCKCCLISNLLTADSPGLCALSTGSMLCGLCSTAPSLTPAPHIWPRPLAITLLNPPIPRTFGLGISGKSCNSGGGLLFNMLGTPSCSSSSELCILSPSSSLSSSSSSLSSFLCNGWLLLLFPGLLSSFLHVDTAVGIPLGSSSAESWPIIIQSNLL